MKSKSSFFCLFLILIFILGLTLLSTAHAAVQWEIQKTISFESTPDDVAVSVNGKWIYVLTGNNEIQIFSSSGALKDTIRVTGEISQIQAGPREDILLVSSRKDKTLQVLAIDFIQDIDTSGAPFLGSAAASVVIVVFTDYQ